MKDWILPETTRKSVQQWYAERAADVDQQTISAHKGLRHAADIGVLSLGVPASRGGAGGSREEMVEAVALIAGQCMTSAFVLWCHRMFVAYAARSESPFLLENILPDVLSVERLGATGLANAIKHAASMEELSVTAKLDGDNVVLNGGIRWASNLVGNRFVVGVAAQVDDDRAALIAVPAEAEGVEVGSIYPLTGLGGTQSSSLRFNNVTLDRQWVVSDDLFPFIDAVRPEFISLQSGLGWGLAAAALDSVKASRARNHSAIKSRLERFDGQLQELVADIRRLSRLQTWNRAEKYQGLKTRKEIAELAASAVWLELESAGGRGYMVASATSRRLRESAFLPVQSPSLVQLTDEIQQLEAEAG